MTEPDARAQARSACEADYLHAIADRGVEAFLRNGAGLSMRVSEIDGESVPIVVSDGRPGKASMLMPRAHYLDYPIFEIGRSPSWWTAGRLRTALLPVAVLLRLGRIDRVVYVNHWLLVGGPELRLGPGPLRDLVAELSRAFPGHALVFSGIVPDLAANAAEHLVALGGRAVQSRVVYLLDPARSLRGNASKKARKNRRDDHALLRGRDEVRVDDPATLLPFVDRIHDLYRQLYLGKHAGTLNPQYSPEFFRLLLESGAFSWAGWLHDDHLEAFNVQLVRDGVLAWSACGYDRCAPRSRGLYRLVAAEDVAVGERERALVNWGGGNGDFKRWRGARPAFEYDVVFDRHLPPDRRLPWWLLQHARARKNGAPLVPRAAGPRAQRP